MTDRLTELVSSLHTVRQQESALEKTEKAVLAELKPLVDPLLDRYAEAGGDIQMGAGQLVLTRVAGVSRTISGDLLLERGVAPDIIASATKTVPYYQYRIKEAK